MKKIFIVVALMVFMPSLLCASEPPYWSNTGHRTIGGVAEKYLKRSTRKELNDLLEGRSLTAIANFADEIKADTLYRKYSSWHYVNLPPDKDYDEITPSKYGDLVVGVRTCIEKIKDKTVSKAERSFYVKMLVHLIGDLHQPMHVGRAEDKGGNDFQLRWFDRGTNLHKVWDSDLVNYNGMSYSEITINMPQLSKTQLKNWQSGNFLDWVHESRDMATKVYDGVEVGEQLGYFYGYQWWPVAEQQLQKGGVRLAKVLNDLF